MTSVLWARFDHAIAEATGAIIATQVSPWSHLHSGRPMVVPRHDGTLASYTGVKYVGEPQQAFWRNYIEPFLEQLAVGQLRAAAAAARDGGHDAAEVIGEVDALLVAACRKVYLRMADVDARLRTEGYPDGIEKRSTRREQRAMEEFIHRHSASLVAMAAVAAPKATSVGVLLGSRKWVGIALVVAMVLLGYVVLR